MNGVTPGALACLGIIWEVLLGFCPNLNFPTVSLTLRAKWGDQGGKEDPGFPSTPVPVLDLFKRDSTHVFFEISKPCHDLLRKTQQWESQHERYQN